MEKAEYKENEIISFVHIKYLTILQHKSVAFNYYIFGNLVNKRDAYYNENAPEYRELNSDIVSVTLSTAQLRVCLP